MRTFLRRLVMLLIVLCVAFLGVVGYTFSRLPDTFLVAQGQPLTIAPMPWVRTADTGDQVLQASAVPVGGSYNTTLTLWGVVPVKTVRTVVVDRRVVTVCGSPFGVKMFSDGALVVGFSDIRSASGYCNPARDAGLEMGDWILSVNGSRITGNDDLRAAIQAAGSDPCTVVYERDGVQAVTNLTPVADLSDGNFRAGVWVRDSSAGVGTLTFVDNTTGMFGGLGHSISDTDTGESIVLRSGEIVPVEIIGYEPGQVGDPGQLKGRFASQIAVGTVLGNDATGVYGTVRTLLGGQDMTVAQSQEVEEGPAQILTTIEGTEPQLYEVEIEQVTLSRQDPNRNLVLRVTDPDLLATTGGIVQGMSGSPIIQNGRLVGAVTHVLVNDSTRGYGIFAENMLETADGLAKEQDAAA